MKRSNLPRLIELAERALRDCARMSKAVDDCEARLAAVAAEVDRQTEKRPTGQAATTA